MAVEGIGRQGHRLPAVRHLHKGHCHTGLLFCHTELLFCHTERSECISFLANHRHGPFLNRLRNIGVSIAGIASYSYKQGSGHHFAGIAANGSDVHIGRAFDFLNGEVAYDFAQFHYFSISLTVWSALALVPGAGDWLTTWPLPSYWQRMPRVSSAYKASLRP